MVDSSTHDASASAVGYLFQVKWALLEILQRAASRPESALSLERLDDVAWEIGGTPQELLQLKHHTGAAATIGDKADDVWRTLRVWMDVQELSEPDLYLVTTQLAAPGSALAVLRSAGRDPVLAETILLDAARTSTAQGTKAVRQRFLDLDASKRKNLVSRIHVLDGAATAGDVDELVREILYFSLPKGHEDTFLGLLWAWWFRVSLDMLQGRRQSVAAHAVQAKVSDIRDDFSRDQLPTLAPQIADEAGLEAEHANHLFVHQLSWVHAPPRILTKAVADYYRAVTQTRLWLEDDLVGIDELQRFEDKLRDEWERQFAWVLAGLPNGASDEDQWRAGQALLRQVLDQSHIRVRERYDDPFFSRGKYHELAEGGRVGWHPAFEARLQQLLLDAS